MEGEGCAAFVTMVVRRAINSDEARRVEEGWDMTKLINIDKGQRVPTGISYLDAT